MNSASIIELANANIYQRDNIVLSDVTFSIGKGEFVYLIGKTGSGKSSLLKTLYAELPATEGTVNVAGFDLTDDRGRIGYASAAAELLASVPNAVEREIYTARAAETAGISAEGLKSEVTRMARKNRGRARRREERDGLRAVASRQPRERSLRYEDTRSAMAEQAVISLLLLDDSVFGAAAPVTESDFSSPVLGRMFTALWSQRQHDGKVSVNALGEQFTAEEISHLVSITQHTKLPRDRGKMLRDCVGIIRESVRKRNVAAGDVDPLLSAYQKYKRNSDRDGGTTNGN